MRNFEIEIFKVVNNILFVFKLPYAAKTYRNLLNHKGFPVAPQKELIYSLGGNPNCKASTQSVWKHERDNQHILNGQVRRITDLHNGRDVYHYSRMNHFVEMLKTN
jgi:hypothetical protein